MEHQPDPVRRGRSPGSPLNKERSSVMKITIWGARGSIPVSGAQYLKYGGDTTCLEIETKSGGLIILDAGTGIRALGNRMLTEGRSEAHLLLSHAHWDHLLGFPFFKPLYRKSTVVRFHGCTHAQDSLRVIMEETMRAPFFPVNLTDVAATIDFDRECPPEFEMDGVSCRTFPLSHPNQGYGFILAEDGREVAFFPDNEPMYDHGSEKSFGDYVEFLRGVDLLIHDGEYLPEEYEAFSRGWGHSVYTDTVRLALAAGVGELMLWHINQDRTDRQADALLDKAKEAIGRESASLKCSMARTGLTLEL